MTKTGLKLPYEDSKIAVYLRKTIDALSGMKTQREIAAEMGYDKPNVLSMYKRGEAKVPLDRIPAMAQALHTDPVFLFKIAIEQYWPRQEATIAKIFGTLATERQAEWLKAIQEISGEDDPQLTPERRQALAECLGRVN